MTKKILIVDDSQTVLETMGETLRAEGYTTILASTGEEGVQKAIDEKPDVAIIDTLLPGIDGFEVCRQIKEKCGPQAPKIIATTSEAKAVDVGKAREAGTDEYCVKTSDFALMVESVKKIEEQL